MRSDLFAEQRFDHNDARLLDPATGNIAAARSDYANGPDDPHRSNVAWRVIDDGKA